MFYYHTTAKRRIKKQQFLSVLTTRVISWLEVMYGLMRIVIVIEISWVLNRLVIHIRLPFTRNLLILWPRRTMILPRHIHHMSLNSWGIVRPTETRWCERWTTLLSLHRHTSLVLWSEKAWWNTLHRRTLRHSWALRPCAWMMSGRTWVHRRPVMSL